MYKNECEFGKGMEVNINECGVWSFGYALMQKRNVRVSLIRTQTKSFLFLFTTRGCTEAARRRRRTTEGIREVRERKEKTRLTNPTSRAAWRRRTSLDPATSVIARDPDVTGPYASWFYVSIDTIFWSSWSSKGAYTCLPGSANNCKKLSELASQHSRVNRSF